MAGLLSGGIGLYWGVAAALKVQEGAYTLFSPWPALDALCLEPGFPLLLGALPLILVSEGIVRRAGRAGRVVRMGGAILLMLALPNLFVFGRHPRDPGAVDLSKAKPGPGGY